MQDSDDPQRVKYRVVKGANVSTNIQLGGNGDETTYSTDDITDSALLSSGGASTGDVSIGGYDPLNY